jgi:hypothetical protein
MLESCVHRVPSGAHISAEVDANGIMKEKGGRRAGVVQRPDVGALVKGVQTGRTVVRSASGSKIRVIPKCDTTTHPMLFPSHKPKHQHRAPGAVVPPVAPARQLLQFPPDYGEALIALSLACAPLSRHPSTDWSGCLLLNGGRWLGSVNSHLTSPLTSHPASHKPTRHTPIIVFRFAWS